MNSYPSVSPDGVTEFVISCISICSTTGVKKAVVYDLFYLAMHSTHFIYRYMASEAPVNKTKHYLGMSSVFFRYHKAYFLHNSMDNTS